MLARWLVWRSDTVPEVAFITRSGVPQDSGGFDDGFELSAPDARLAADKERKYMRTFLNRVVNSVAVLPCGLPLLQQLWHPVRVTLISDIRIAGQKSL